MASRVDVLEIGDFDLQIPFRGGDAPVPELALHVADVGPSLVETIN
jgi:hypothetical protein